MTYKWLSSLLTAVVVLSGILRYDVMTPPDSMDGEPVCNQEASCPLPWAPLRIARSIEWNPPVFSDFKWQLMVLSDPEQDHSQFIASFASSAQAGPAVGLLNLYSLQVKLQV